MDHWNCFDNWSSYKVFLLFSSLVAWIAEHVKCICNLKMYVDDSASFGLARDVLYQACYGRYYPTNQICLLLLWDELGIPHEEKKQIYSPIIPFIGFEVEPNTMTIFISDSCHTDLMDKIFTLTKPGKCHFLHVFQLLAGYVNWSLAVFPLLRPSLSTFYSKISGKSCALAHSCQ